MTALEPNERAACIGLIASECAGPVEWYPVAEAGKPGKPRPCRTASCRRATERPGSRALFAYCRACTARLLRTEAMPPNGRGA